jgi:hypothetical protein
MGYSRKSILFLIRVHSCLFVVLSISKELEMPESYEGEASA